GCPGDRPGRAGDGPLPGKGRMSMDDRWSKEFPGRRCLITGGLGFIGSTLALRLVELGAHVTLVDAMIPEYGGNLFNVEPIRDRVIINFGGICDSSARDWLGRNRDLVCHFGGHVSYAIRLT